MRYLAVLLAALALAGCGSPDVPGSASSTPAATVSPVTDPDVATAIADLAERAGVAEDEIAVVSVDEVTWRNSSLGCPEPGGRYLQVLTDGRRVVLEASGRRYEYHSGGRRGIFYCATPQRPVGE